MFIDVKSSTSIAEKIGHLQFLTLLREFYFDLSEAVAISKGEIYKYVGDEAIIIWNIKKGIKNNNVIACFFELKSAINKKSSYYTNKFGVVPEFKAGVHCGKVVIGEIGDQKKEITYLGDVLNTTSRIEGMCTTLTKELIISTDLKQKLFSSNMFSYEDLGEISLRGKDTPIKLFSVHDYCKK